MYKQESCNQLMGACCCVPVQFEVSVLSSTVKNLQHENLRLEVHSQGVSDTNEELKEQVAELQSQLQQLKDTHLEQEQAHELELAQFSQVSYATAVQQFTYAAAFAVDVLGLVCPGRAMSTARATHSAEQLHSVDVPMCAT